MGIIAYYNCTQSGGKKGKRQRYGDRNTWTGGILLCAVTKEDVRQRRTYSEGTGKAAGKRGKKDRWKMALQIRDYSIEL